MATERLRDRGQRPLSVSAQEEHSQPPLHRCSAFSFFPQPFIKCFLASFLIYNTANLLSSHMTSLDQSAGHLMERMLKLVCTCPKLVSLLHTGGVLFVTANGCLFPIIQINRWHYNLKFNVNASPLPFSI